MHQWDEEERNTPSAHFNFEKELWHCKAQKCHEAIKTLSALWRDVQESYKEEQDQSKSKKAKGKVEPLPSLAQLDRWHSDLINSKAVLDDFLDTRGLTIETLSRFKIGYRKDRKRFTIPIFDRDGDLLDVRQYRLRSKEAGNKMISVAGHGGAHLYGVERLLEEHKYLILTEGEMDRLTGEEQGFPTVTHTSGAKAWQDKWSYLFEGKVVFIIYDNDEEGRQGARKTKMSLQRANAEPYIVQLGLDIKRGDLTDFFVKRNHTRDDLEFILEETRTGMAGSQPNTRTRYPEGEAKKVSVEESLNPDHGRIPLRMIGTVSGKAEAPTVLPRKASFVCDMSYGDKCDKCPVAFSNGERTLEFDPRDELLLSLVEKTDEQRHRGLLRAVGAPLACPKVEIYPEEEWTIEEILVVPSVEDRNEEVQTPVNRVVYNVGSYKIPINTNFEFLGTSLPSPKDGKSIFHAWESERVDTDIDKFHMTPQIMDELDVFQVDDWNDQTPFDKMKEIARDLSANVTKIYGRDELHMAYDLVWHSIVDFRFGGNLLGKGWLELLVMGDTRTGKSEVAQRLAEHYQAGILKTCEGASFAGLVGGAEQKGGRSWGITWGTIPLQDRRLVILDEASGLVGKNIIEQMSAIRSMGRAQITKMGGQETSARTRLIWISNPVDGRTIEEMPRGAIDAIEGLVKNPEDIARFDLAMAAASGDVQSSVINSRVHVGVPHLHTSRLSKLLVTWAWSRRAEHVRLGTGVEDYIFSEAEKLGERYVVDPPLIQKQNVRVKLARMAVAVAARVFSTDQTGELVLVGKEHVDTALRLLDILYGMNSFGYKEHSMRQILMRRMAERNYGLCKQYLLGEDRVWDTLKQVFNDTSFKHRDFRDFGGMSDEQASDAVNMLSEWGMIRRLTKGSMKMEAPLVSLVKEILLQEEKELYEEGD